MPAPGRPQMWTPADYWRVVHPVAAAADPALTTDRMSAPTRHQTEDHSGETDWEADLAWAAGLFEGEGSFGMRSNGTVLVSVASTDKDVIDRFRSVVGAGRLSSQAPGRNHRNKRLWRLDISQVDDVLRITRLLYPWLGNRRRSRADEAAAAIRTRIDAATVQRVCPNCGESFRPPFTPNAARTKYCSRQCERRYHWRLRWQRAREVGK
jgi:hypothetical protein